jgi:predicted RNase H-like HicB family nuclease
LNEYVVIYEKADDGGWGAYSPDLPGVITLGDTRDEVELNMREAIRAHLDELGRSGQPMPETRSVVGTVTV